MSNQARADEPMMLTVPQVARRLQIARKRAYELVAAGQLPVVQLGRSLRVPLAALNRWIEESTRPGRPSGAPEPLESTHDSRGRR